MIIANKNEQGFTLVETMVVVSIFILIIAAIFGTASAGRRSWLTAEALLMTRQGARIGLSNMVKELRLSSSGHVTVSADNSVVTFDIPFDADADGFLDVIANTDSIVFGAHNHQGWQIRYQINAADEQIVREILDNSGALVSQTILVRNIKLREDDDDPGSALVTFFQTDTGGLRPNAAVDIRITTEVDEIQGLILENPLQTTLSTRVNLRN